MLSKIIKRKLINFIQFNFQPRIESLHAENIFQGLFNQQCLNFGVRNDFYPVGAAASYSLMYLLTRIMKELPIRNVIEFGSGQSTVLIDRIKEAGCSHIAYEQNTLWANILRSRLSDCDLRESAMTPMEHNGITYLGFQTLEIQPFDLLLVDGPIGTDEFSRFACVPLIEANVSREFVIIFDDASRPGEQDTISHVTDLLSKNKVDFKLNYLSGRTTQALITTPKYRAASYFF